MVRKRLTREESRALTQERLLEAAAKGFARHGFEGVSVETITEAAGFSRGAFYSNFKSKDELFLALIEKELKRITQETRVVAFETARSEELVSAFRKYYTTFGKMDKDAFLLITEAQLYAVRNAKFRSKLNMLFKQMHDELKAPLEALRSTAASRKDLAPELVALIGLSLSHGLTLYNLLDAKNYPDPMVASALELVFDQLIKK
jgi:AcrR family transcriptional regulator